MIIAVMEKGKKMSRYINVDKVLEKYSEDGNWDLHKVLKGEPPADVRENVHGEWIEWQKCTPFYIQDLYKCSKCNESYLKELVYFLDNLQYRFCPNCGADMRKGETNERSDQKAGCD